MTMAQEQKQQESRNIFETHIQTVMAALLLAAITWVGAQIMSQNTQLGVVVNRLDTLDSRLDTITTRFDSYQTLDSSRAQRDHQSLRFDVTQEHIKRIEKRVDKLEERN